MSPAVKFKLSKRQLRSIETNAEIPIAIPTDSTFDDGNWSPSWQSDYVKARLAVPHEWIKGIRLDLIRVRPLEWPGQSILPNISRDRKTDGFTADVRWPRRKKHNHCLAPSWKTIRSSSPPTCSQQPGSRSLAWRRIAVTNNCSGSWERCWNLFRTSNSTAIPCWMT